MSKGALTRASILDQAASMAGILGLEGLTIGRLAAETGMSKSGLFGHFGSKEALQLAVLETAVEDFANQVILPSLQETTGEARLKKLFTNWMEWTTLRGCPLMGASVELDDRPGELRTYLAEQQLRWLDSIRRMAQKAVSEGSFQTGLDTRQFAFEFHSIGLGYNFSLRLLDDPDALRRARTAFSDLLGKARAN